MLVPFNVVISQGERDKELHLKLRAELPGILNWALEGCLTCQQYGLATPAEVKDATEEYRQEEDVLGPFIQERCLVTPKAEVGATDLYQEYKRWCDETGDKPASQTVFGRLLTNRGFPPKKRSGRRWREGISLLG